MTGRACIVGIGESAYTRDRNVCPSALSLHLDAALPPAAAGGPIPCLRARRGGAAAHNWCRGASSQPVGCNDQVVSPLASLSA